jgi:transcriptional regulator with XRE-family HTH domain
VHDNLRRPDQTALMSNSAASRRQLHTELYRLRLAAGLTQSDVARAHEWSASKVHRIEKGHVSISRTDLLALLDQYGVTDSDAVETFLDLARDARRRPPYAAYRDVFSPEIIRYLGYEASASWIGEMALTIVPGLLQTADYTRALMAAGQGLDGRRAERIVASRAERQRMLDRPQAPRVSFLLDESVLLRPIGGAAVLRAQLAHLLEVARSPRVDVRVLPMALGAHAGLRGSFVLLRFPAITDPDIVFVENRVGDAIFENEAEVTDNFTRVFDDLQGLATETDDLATVVGRALRAL